MGHNRRIGKSARFAKKKKAKISERLRNPNRATDDSGDGAAAAAAVARPLRGDNGARSSGSKKKAARKAPRGAGGSSISAKALAAQRSRALRKQAVERMVLKEHLRDLKQRRAHTGDRSERRELTKYIKTLMKEQLENHKKELDDIEERQRQQRRRAALGVPSVGESEGALLAAADEAEGVTQESELREMFAHLLH